MTDLNEVKLIGRVGKDPAIKQASNGNKFITLAIATEDSYKTKTGEVNKTTDWHNVVIYSEGLVKLVSSYVKKGSRIFIEGQLKTRKWADSNGVEKYTTEIVLKDYSSKVILLDSFEKKQEVSSPKKADVSKKVVELDDDEIPF
jgi:single-strand DNA-binding protein